MFGLRWIDHFGSAPSDEWRAAVQRLEKSQLDYALNHLREADPPYAGWMPALNEFMAIARRCKIPKAAVPDAPKPTWVEGVCSAAVIRLIYELSKRDVMLSNEDLMIFVRARDRTVEQFNQVITVDKTLKADEVKRLMWERFQRTVQEHPSLGQVASNFSTLPGPLTPDGPLTLGSSSALVKIGSIPLSNISGEETVE